MHTNIPLRQTCILHTSKIYIFWYIHIICMATDLIYFDRQDANSLWKCSRDFNFYLQALKIKTFIQSWGGFSNWGIQEKSMQYVRFVKTVEFWNDHNQLNATHTACKPDILLAILCRSKGPFLEKSEFSGKC